MKKKLMILHRILVKKGSFEQAGFILKLLNKGKVNIFNYKFDFYILQLIDLDNEIIFDTNSNLVWRTYGLYRKGEKDIIQNSCPNSV